MRLNKKIAGFILGVATVVAVGPAFLTPNFTPTRASGSYVCYGNIRIETTIVDGQEVYTVTHIGSDATDVIIPAEINGIPVSGISADAFADCKDNLESVTIDGNITIEKGTFNNCQNELDFTVTGDMTELNYEEIFEGTTLGTITIPETVTYITPETFYGVTDTTNFVYEGSFDDFYGTKGSDGIFGSLWTAFKNTMNSSTYTNASMPTNIIIGEKTYTIPNDSSLSSTTVRYYNGNKDAFGYRRNNYYKNNRNI